MNIYVRLYLSFWIVFTAMLLSPVDSTASGWCISREQAIALIAHKTDIEYPGILSKQSIWAIGDRESYLTHCWPNGLVKISPTGDYGLLQMHPFGVWRNCALNRYCAQSWMIESAEAQVDVMINYYRVYHDLCPWNPSPQGNYMPGCGYGD